MARNQLFWQSKLVLLLVVPFVAAGVVLQTHWWAYADAPVALWTLGISAVLGLVAFKLRSATLAAAATGAVITASLMFSTATLPYLPWRTALIPVLVLMVLTALSTSAGRQRKQQLGTAEDRSGRTAAQVASNLGFAALASSEAAQSLLSTSGWLPDAAQAPMLPLTVGLAALAEAAADTVSSELGQLLSAQPRLLTTLRPVAPGTDGAISLGGTTAGICAAALIAATGAATLHGGLIMFAVSWSGAIFGLFFDSLLGATLERPGWLNNDAVNFLSTVAASAFALVLLALLAYTRNA